MSNIQFSYTTFWDNYTVLYSSQHPNFPALNTKKRWKAKGWRSRYGNLSGWGTFVIDATNNKLYFDEGGGTLTATITIGTYNADTLADEIETQLEAAGAHSYSIIYNDVTNKFELTDDTGTFQLELTNTTNDIWDEIGFTSGADTAFLAEHISEELRIHTEEWISINGDAENVDIVFIPYSNVSATGTIKLQGSNDNFATIVWSVDLDSGSNYRFAKLPSSTVTQDDWRIYIQDKDNADGYIEVGRVWLGVLFKPQIGVNPSLTDKPVDPSTLRFSEGRQAATIQREHYETFRRKFDHLLPADKVTFDLIKESRGTSRELVVLFKSTDNTSLVYAEPETYGYYIYFKKFSYKTKDGVVNLDIEMIEEL